MATLHVDINRDWLPLTIQAISVLITFLAVIVALFGPAWRAYRRRPLLSLGIEYDRVPMGAPVPMVHLTVTNHPRKETATDVEVYVLSMRAPPQNMTRGAHYDFAISPRRPLRWSEPLDNPASQTVPAGFTRRCDFIRYIPAQQTGLQAEIVTPEKMELAVIPNGIEFQDFWTSYQHDTRDFAFIRIALAGRNLQTVCYDIRVSYLRERRQMYDGALESYFDFEGPHRVGQPKLQAMKERFRRVNVWWHSFTYRGHPRQLPVESSLARYLVRRRAPRALPNKSMIKSMRERRRKGSWEIEREREELEDQNK
jgi:hypothetical protein